MSHKLLIEWMAFSELEPFDETRDDIRSASIQATLCEIKRDRDRRKQPYTWMDFKVPFGDEPRMETPSTVKDAPTPARSSAELKFMAQMIVADANAAMRRKR
jgi:hypothetical protein